MKKNKLILALLIVSSLSAQKRSIPADTIVSTNHTTKITTTLVIFHLMMITTKYKFCILIIKPI